MFAPLYNCAKCGNTFNVTTVECIDTENDEVWDEVVCATCYGYVTPIMRDGQQIHHVLTPEEMEDEMYGESYDYFYDEDESDFDLK